MAFRKLNTITIFATIIALSTINQVTNAQLAPSPGPIIAMGPSSSFGPSGTDGPVASGPSSQDCLTALFNMSDCLTYVEAGSNSTVPDKNCCPEFAGLIESSPICLCRLLSDSNMTASFGIQIDMSKAVKLPNVCKVQTPPVSSCSAVGYPVPGPASALPMAPGVQPPGDAAASSPGGAASSPAGNSSGNENAKNAASTIEGSASLLFLVAFLSILFF